MRFDPARGYHRVVGTIPASPAAADDIWPGSVAYPFPAAAAATTVVSGSANDAAAGTGVRTVRVVGLTAAFAVIDEVATLNGTTPVALTGVFYRILSLTAVTVGSGGVAAGAISVRHSSTELAIISVGAVEGLAAIFTVPALAAVPAAASGAIRPSLLGWTFAGNSGLSSTAAILRIRPVGALAWDIVDFLSLIGTGSTPGAGGGTFGNVFPQPLPLEPGTDVAATLFATNTAPPFFATIDFAWR